MPSLSSINHSLERLRPSFTQEFANNHPLQKRLQGLGLLDNAQASQPQPQPQIPTPQLLSGPGGLPANFQPPQPVQPAQFAQPGLLGGEGNALGGMNNLATNLQRNQSVDPNMYFQNLMSQFNPFWMR